MSRPAVLAALLVLLSPAMASALPEKDPTRMLAGRTAGKPVSCIPDQHSGIDSQIFDGGRILYKSTGGTWYLNTLPNCPQLTATRSYATSRYSSSICRGDLIEVIDPPAPISYGACPLGDFVPYTKPKR